MSGSLILRGGRVVDPAQSIDHVADVVVRDGVVAEILDSAPTTGSTEIDARGKVVAPGLIDLHVHLRVPGLEYKETMATGTAAAAAGGFTSICCMPNTRPAIDSVDVLRGLAETIANEAIVRVYPIACITKERAGHEAVDFAALAEAGAIGFSDDGDTTADSLIMRRALEASRTLGLPIMTHCEDKALAHGAMNEGAVSRALGLSGIPSAAEEIIIARDIMLARLTGGWLHVLHVSTGRGAHLVASAKAEGVHVTAEVMPHHLLLSDEWVAGSRTLHNVDEPPGPAAQPAHPDTKVNPPLRPPSDTVHLLQALKAGVFDIIATDHAPHAASEKVDVPFERAAMGMSGLELALPSCLALVRAGHLSLSRMIELLSTAPGRLLKQGTGTLCPGSPADIVVFDPDLVWTVRPEELRTKSHNTPLMGMQLRGRAVATIVAGEIRFGG